MAEKLCEHCREPIAIRNQSGYCDHLRYPENCSICKRITEMREKVKITHVKCAFCNFAWDTNNYLKEVILNHIWENHQDKLITFISAQEVKQ